MGCEGRAESSGTAEKRGPDVFSLLVPQLQACRPGQGRRAVPTSSGSPGGGVKWVRGVRSSKLSPVSEHCTLVQQEGELFRFFLTKCIFLFTESTSVHLKVVRVRSSQLLGNRGPCVESGRKQLHRRGAPDLVLPCQHTVFSSVPPDLQKLLSGRRPCPSALPTHGRGV